MSDDLDRAVDARIDAYRPDTAPSFAALQERKRNRDRRRFVTGAGAMSVAALAAGAVVLPALDGGGDRVVPAATGREPARVQFEVVYIEGPDGNGGADEAALRRCTSYPGGSRDSQKQSDPPVEIVSVIGHPGGVAEFRQCLEDLPNARVTQTGSAQLDRLVTFTLNYRTPVDRPQEDPALLRCLDGPVATAPQFRYRQPPIAVLLAGGSDAELEDVQGCLDALPHVDVTMREAEER